MRNFGRALAALIIWAATAAVFAQTPSGAQAAGSPAFDSTTGEPADGEPAAGDPVTGDTQGGDAATDAPISVAPMSVPQVTIAPTASSPMPTPPVAPARTGPPPMVAVPEAVYVTHFIAVPAGTPPSGFLARLRAALHTHSAGRDAGLVAQAVVQQLNHAGVAARYLAPDEPPPIHGWLPGGVFHVQGDQGAAASGDAQASATDGLGAQVSITVADLEHGADTPFAIIGAPPAATGEADKWHPYLVPAQLSFERADRNAAVAALAQQIVDTFVGNMTALRQADARAISP